MNSRNRFPARRKFLKQSAALSAGAASIAVPAVVLAAPDDAGRNADKQNKENPQHSKRKPGRVA